MFSANQHAEISAYILLTQKAFSVQVKVLRYNFSTVFHSKDTIRKTVLLGFLLNHKIWLNEPSLGGTYEPKVTGASKGWQTNTFYCLCDIASDLLT